MDYAEIDRIMLTKSLATDPAFGDELKISIQEMPNLNGCPLGLYYPDTAAIALPLNASEAALLHELGHRHGHYYHNDLSEKYAEAFRERYQKGTVLLYMGNHFENLPKFGALFDEGQRGAVEVALAHSPTMDELHSFKSQVLSHEVYSEKAPRFYYGGNDTPWVRVEFTQGQDWMMIVGSILAATIVAGAGAIGYAVYKTAEATPWIVPVALAGAVAVLIARAAIKKGYVALR